MTYWWVDLAPPINQNGYFISTDEGPVNVRVPDENDRRCPKQSCNTDDPDRWTPHKKPAKFIRALTNGAPCFISSCDSCRVTYKGRDAKRKIKTTRKIAAGEIVCPNCKKGPADGKVWTLDKRGRRKVNCDQCHLSQLACARKTKVTNVAVARRQNKGYCCRCDAYKDFDDFPRWDLTEYPLCSDCLKKREAQRKDAYETMHEFITTKKLGKIEIAKAGMGLEHHGCSFETCPFDFRSFEAYIENHEKRKKLRGLPYDFHHVDPKLKTSLVSGLHTEALVNAEAELTVAICMPCHKHETVGGRRKNDRLKAELSLLKLRKYKENKEVLGHGCQGCSYDGGVTRECHFNMTLETLAMLCPDKIPALYTKESYGMMCFECDHPDRTNKASNVSEATTLKKAIKEIEKCELLCCFCHRIKTLLQGDTKPLSQRRDVQTDPL